jgi:hypothetical protein
MPEVAGPQRIGRRRRAQRHARMPGPGFLNGVRRQKSDGINTLSFQLVFVRHHELLRENKKDVSLRPKIQLLHDKFNAASLLTDMPGLLNNDCV